MSGFEKRSYLIATTLSVLIAGLGVIPLSAENIAETQLSQSRETPRSTCMAVANDWNNSFSIAEGFLVKPDPFELPTAVRASVSVDVSEYAQVNALSPYQVRITYVDHSTFRIEDATGLTIATDFAGIAGRGIIPDVVTMNHAHGTHFTLVPDKRIPHVLPGWGKDGKPAKYNLQIGEALIRNVTTDIDNNWAGFEPNGNSIFIFEMGGLCIGHLGHLHHLLTDAHYAQIGRLDVLMIPVDGGYTLNVGDMTKIASRLQASLILPMHWFGQSTLSRFLTEVRGRFPVEVSQASGITISLNTLPTQPTVLVLTPEVRFPSPED